MIERTQRTSNRADFSFFLNLPRIFPKGTSRNQKILFFHYFFIFFSEQGSQKHKNWHLQLRSDVIYRNSPRWSRRRLHFKKERLMRISPYWTRRHHRLAIYFQLSYHVTLGFSRHVVSVSIITSSYDIETG